MPKPGWVTVALYDAIEWMGLTHQEVTLRPVRMDDVAAWDAEEVRTTMGLMSRLTQPRISQEALLQLTFPADAPRVREAFLSHLPIELREVVALARTIDREEAKAQEVQGDPMDVGGDPRPWANAGQYPAGVDAGPPLTDDAMPDQLGPSSPDDFTLPE